MKKRCTLCWALKKVEIGCMNSMLNLCSTVFSLKSTARRSTIQMMIPGQGMLTPFSPMRNASIALSKSFSSTITVPALAVDK